MLSIHALPMPKASIRISVKSLGTLGAVVNFATGRAIFHYLDPGRCVQLYRSPGGHLCIDFFVAVPEVVGGRQALMDLSKDAAAESCRKEAGQGQTNMN